MYRTPGIGLSTGGANGGHVDRFAKIQKWHFHIECITSTQRDNARALHTANDFVHQSGGSSSHEQASCSKYRVRIAFQVRLHFYCFRDTIFLNDANWEFLYSLFGREAKRAISNFLCLGCHTVIITLGKDGAIFASSAEPKPIHVKTPRVEEVLDTTVCV